LLTFFNEHAQPIGQSIDTVAAEFTRRGLGRIVTPHGVPLTSLERVHTPRYLHFLRSACASAIDPAALAPLRWPAAGQRRDIEPDDFSGRLGLYATDTTTPLSSGIWTAAKTGADCAINAAHALRLGQRSTFALTLPAGHHAGAESFGGGCYLNNAALAAQHLLDDGLARVAILDIAGHHGSGTQGIFYARRDVLAVSLHVDPRGAYPFYSGHADETGAGDAVGCNLNLPLAAGSGAAAWLAALETACLKMAAYAPQALVVSLGAGALFQLDSADYLRIGERIGYLALPTVFVFEGGAAPESAVHAVNLLEGFDTTA
jgi:acetoin utilization deacetylase AcuC-like enzyme